MAEGNNIFGNKDNKPETTDAKANAESTTTADSGSDTKAAAEVSDAEAKALDGAGGPNLTPAFAKQDSRDENVQLTDTDDLQSAKTGAAAQSTSPRYDINALEAAAAAGDVAEGQEDMTQYTSTPIARLRIGRFQFDGGVLRLNDKDSAEFEKLLKSTDIRTQNLVRKIDRQGGEAIARQFRELNSTSTSGIDTTANSVGAPTPR